MAAAKEQTKEKVDSTARSDDVVISGGQSNFERVKHWLIPVIVLVAFVLVGSGFAVYKLVLHKDSPATTEVAAKKVCSQAQLAAVHDAITNKSVADLKKAKESITANADYNKDPNCLYAVAQYYTEAGETVKANETVAAFNQVYDPEKGLDKTLTTKPAEAVQVLQQTVQRQTTDVDGVQTEVQSQL